MLLEYYQKDIYLHPFTAFEISKDITRGETSFIKN